MGCSRTRKERLDNLARQDRDDPTPYPTPWEYEHRPKEVLRDFKTHAMRVKRHSPKKTPGPTLDSQSSFRDGLICHAPSGQEAPLFLVSPFSANAGRAPAARQPFGRVAPRLLPHSAQAYRGPGTRRRPFHRSGGRGQSRRRGRERESAEARPSGVEACMCVLKAFPNAKGDDLASGKTPGPTQIGGRAGDTGRRREGSGRWLRRATIVEMTAKVSTWSRHGLASRRRALRRRHQRHQDPHAEQRGAPARRLIPAHPRPV